MSLPAQQQPNTPDYLSTLGLDRAPYLDKIDDHFFYADPALVQRLDLLQHLTRFGDMLLGITGPLGSGKSTLLQQFLLRGNTTWRSGLIDGGKIKQPNEMLARLAECFGQDMTAAPERIKADIIRYCQSLQHNSQQAVIAIDDAHLLPEPALKALLELGGDARETLKLVRVLLFSEPGLEKKFVEAGLHSPQQPLLHSLDVPRFDEQQTAAYLMYRLAAAGYSGDSPFSLTEIRAMHKAADALPGRLNTLAHETLIEHANRLAARKKAKPDPKPAATDAPSQPRTRTRAVLTLVGVLLTMGAVGGYLMQSGNLQAWLEMLGRFNTEQTLALDSAPEPVTDESAGTVQSEAPDAQIAAAAATPKAMTAAGQTEILEPATNKPQQHENKDNIIPIEPIVLTAVEPPAEPDTSPAPEPTTSEPAAETAETAEAAANTQVEISPSDGKIAESVLETPPLLPEATMDTPPVDAAASADKQATATEKPEIPSPEPASTPTDSAEPPKPISPARETTTIVTTPKASAPPENADLLGAAWLLARPAEHFTLQLLGVRNESSLKNFLAHSQLPGPVAYFHTEYKGGDWYVLVQGDYPTMTAARTAISALPAAVRKSKPWPRTFSTVQADIQKVAP